MSLPVEESISGYVASIGEDTCDESRGTREDVQLNISDPQR